MTKTFRERHPGPWTITETTGGYRVDDATGFPLAYVYCEHPNTGSAVTGHRNLSRSEALALAEAICRLAKPAQEQV